MVDHNKPYSVAAGPRRKWRQTSYSPQRFSRVPRFRAGFNRTAGYYGRYPRASQGESKFFDTTVAQTTVQTAGNILSPSLNLIPQGTTESNRDGRKCVVTALNMRGQVTIPSVASAGQADRVRIIVYQDKQANGSPATVTQILETAAVNSFRNLAESQRFTILKDQNVDLVPQYGSTAGSGEINYSWKFYKKCNIPLEFNSTTGAITEIRSNNIGVLVISFDGTNTTASFGFTSRVRFRG